MSSTSPTRADQYRSPSLSPAWRARRAFSPREAWKIEIDLDGHCELMRGYLDFEALGDRLAALCAVVGDAAQHVELGHVSRRTATRDVVADGPVAIDDPRGPVPTEAGDIDQVPFIKAAVAHVVGFHEHNGAQALQPAVAVVVGVDRGVELVVRAHRGQHQPPLAGNGAVWERREPELGPAGSRPESA